MKYTGRFVVLFKDEATRDDLNELKSIEGFTFPEDKKSYDDSFDKLKVIIGRYLASFRIILKLSVAIGTQVNSTRDLAGFSRNSLSLSRNPLNLSRNPPSLSCSFTRSTLCPLRKQLYHLSSKAASSLLLADWHFFFL